MAANGADQAFAPADVVTALATMKGGAHEAKLKAHTYLEGFQKSKAAWATTLGMLRSGAEPDVKLFAAITLRGKITCDLGTQVQPEELPALRNEIFLLLKHFAAGPRPIRVYLSVCLADLAIQMTEWKDVIPTVVSALGTNVEGHAAILDFLKVLPEEVIDGRKLSLSEDELNQRADELLRDNSDKVLQLLVNYSQSSPTAAQNPQLIDCISSWLRELPVSVVVKTPLLDIIFNGVLCDDTIQEAAECLCVMFGDTREVDENLETIETLFPRVVALIPKLQESAQEEDTEAFKAITKIFSVAAQAWSVAIVRHPKQFRPLVEAVLECAARDKDRDAIKYTFEFWYDFRMYLVLDRYEEARQELLDIFPKLVDVLLERLQYPRPESGSEKDLFEGDREQEEQFREFRHKIGDTLKDAAEVLGPSQCLRRISDAIKVWTQKYGNQATANSVPHWQELESPLFAMRALGSEVSPKENEVLPTLMPLLIQIPEHPRLRFVITMVFGRYTEWTAAHPELFQAQFKYIVSSFDSDDKDVIRAAALSFRYFCVDCPELLGDQALQLQAFYDGVLDKLPDLSRDEITQGVSAVVGHRPVEAVFALLKLYVDPLVVRMMKMADGATTDKAKRDLADHIQLLTIFVRNVAPNVEVGQKNPAVTYWAEVFPVLAKIMHSFSDFSPILERVCRCWRSMLISYRTAMQPLLSDLANALAAGFETTKEGCFLWVTGSILREFTDDREEVDPQMTQSIYSFFEVQTVTFLRVMNQLPPKDLPDVIEDFFRLLLDALLFYPYKLVSSNLFAPVFEAATFALVLEQRDPVDATLYFLRDLLTYTGDNPASSPALPPQTAREIRGYILQLLNTHGEALVKQIVSGLALTFHSDCTSNASGVLESMLGAAPSPTLMWMRRALDMLPAGTLMAAEINKMMGAMEQLVRVGGPGWTRKARSLVESFVHSYRRRYVAPREGLGLLGAERFHFSG